MTKQNNRVKKKTNHVLLMGVAACLALLATPTIVAVAQTPTPQPPHHQNPERVLLGWNDTTQQQHDNTCGLAVIATLLRWQGDTTTTEKTLSQEVTLSKDGISLYDFATLAKKHGLHGVWVEASLNNIEELETPFVAHIKDPNGHFVVVQRAYNNHVLIADPNAGNVLYTQTAFGRVWTRRAYLGRIPQ